MNVKLSITAYRRLNALLDARGESVTVNDATREGARKQTHYVHYLQPEDATVLAQVLDQTPPEEVFMTDRGLGLRQSWLKKLVALNQHLEAEDDLFVDESSSTNLAGKAAERVGGSDQPDKTKTNASPPPEGEPKQPAPKPWGELSLELLAESIEVDKPAADWILADVAAVEIALNGASEAKDKKERRVQLQALLDRNERRLPKVAPAHLSAVASLRSRFPNFGEVIDLIEEHLSLLLLTEEPLSLPPLLLLGEPGVGKTYFAETLSKQLGMTYEARSMAETSAGFAIVGSHSTWATAQIGCVAKMIIHAPDNTVGLFLIDEIDKATKGSHPPENTLLGLLESHTAQHFRDEFLDVAIDARPLSVMMTANKALSDGSPLASRMSIIEVPMPTADQMPMIVKSVDAGIRSGKPGIDKHFAPLSEEVINALAVEAPRAIKKTLRSAYAKAARGTSRLKPNEKRALTLEHFGKPPQPISPNAKAKKVKHEPPLFVIDAGPFFRIH